MSMRELPDGRVLLHCFAGCDVGDVVAAIGLDLAALFPDRPPHVVVGGRPLKRRRLITASQALEILEDEITLAMVCASDVARGATLDDATRERLMVGAARIAQIRDEVHA